MAELHAMVYGFVQGVGFRHFVAQKARALSLKGIVKNSPDGSVEVMAQGSRENLELLLEELKKGPGYGRVDKVKAEWQKETKGFGESFSVEF
ncbi:MAG: acylphosphatase [archaeon]